jgi:hypothetical protein
MTNPKHIDRELQRIREQAMQALPQVHMSVEEATDCLYDLQLATKRLETLLNLRATDELDDAAWRPNP